MSIQRVAEMKTEPVVGRLYLVQCAPVRDMDFAIPVFGDLHEDRKLIGFPDEHWHIDWRFMTSRLWSGMGFGDDFKARMFLGDVFGWPITIRQVAGEVRERRRKCRSAMPLCGLVRRPRIVRIMDGAYAGASVVKVNDCSVCPHRGLPLDSLPREPDGSVVCRGHGLAFGPDGKVKRRIPLETAK